MNYLKFDLNNLIKVERLKKEKYSKDNYIEPRTLNYYAIYFIVSGKLKIQRNEETLILSKGDFHIFSKGEALELFPCGECKFYQLEFDSENLEELTLEEKEYSHMIFRKKMKLYEKPFEQVDVFQNLDVCLGKHYAISDEENFNKIKDFMETHYQTYDARSLPNRLIISGELQEILFQLETVSMKKKEFKTYILVKGIFEYVDENYNLEFGRKEIESKFFINFDYVNRLFGGVTGCSIMRYRNLYRINKAKEIMKTTDMNMVDIAKKIGFTSGYYFSRIFKKYEGISPATYKKKLIKEINK